MVSFSCEGCGDILTKKKLDPHRNQCYGATFTCIDCMVHFQGTSYRTHTSCMSEAQKYQGHLYRGEKKGKGGQKRQEQAVVPHKAPEPSVSTVATVDVPPKAPTPPPTGEDLPPGVNVFDYMVSKNTPARIAPTSAADASKNGSNSNYQSQGYSYGNAPVDSSFERYDSQASLPPYVTPASKHNRNAVDKGSEKNQSEKKRKRAQEDRDMADVAPLHTGLTGGLNRMLSGPDFGHSDAVAPSPLSPNKRSKKDKSGKHSSASTTKSSSSRHKHSGDEANAEQEQRLVTYRSPAEHFLSFVTKGPDSERGLSINKALKRYHRERQSRGERDDGDKDLWKDLRIRKNEKGEYILFV